MNEYLRTPSSHAQLRVGVPDDTGNSRRPMFQMTIPPREATPQDFLPCSTT